MSLSLLAVPDVGLLYETSTLVSEVDTALVSVRVTVLPEITGVVELIGVDEPFFFTVKAELARFRASSSGSLRVITSVVPFTVAETNVGAVVSWLR